jgi:transposase
MHVIGEDAAERLDAIPALYRLIVTHRPKSHPARQSLARLAA